MFSQALLVEQRQLSGGWGMGVVATNGCKNADKCFRQNTNFTSLTASGVFQLFVLVYF